MSPSSVGSWIQNGTPRPSSTGEARVSIAGPAIAGEPGLRFTGLGQRQTGTGGSRSYFGVLPLAPGPIAEAESGRLPPPARVAEAAAQTPLNSPQQAMAIGEPVPVVFCRRRNSIGGVLLFPKATEAAFSNTSTQQTARYHCVLGVGPMGSIQVRDFRVGACRVGTFSQNYGTRAGTWSPGNTATAQSGYQVPTFPTACGGGGSYAGLATLEFSSTTTGGSDDWRLGCNVYAREGLQVTRILDGVTGGSDNLVDLISWALARSGRVPAAMIDSASLLQAAQFLDVNGLLCNGEFTDSANLGDWLLGILPYFLLRQTGIGGKFGLRPLLPTNYDGTIDTGALTPDWVLTERIIQPGSFQQEWSDAGSRLAPRITMLWRQQDETSVPVVRSLQMRLARASAGPPEQHDLSRYCCSEIHAARVGTYLHGRRYLSTHTASCTLVPGSQTGRMAEGDIVQAILPLVTGREADGSISEWYSVESIAPAADGSEALTLAHFPVDSQARSLLALEVAQVAVPGSLLPHPPTGACDLAGRSVDTSVPASTTSGTPFTSLGGGMTIGPGTTSQGSGNAGTYDGVILPDDLPKADGAPKTPVPGGYAPIPGGVPAPTNGPPAGIPVGGSVPKGHINNLNRGLRGADAGGAGVPFNPSGGYGSTWRMVFRVRGGGYDWQGPSIGGTVADDNSTYTIDFSAPFGTDYKIGKGYLGTAVVSGINSWVSYTAWISSGASYLYQTPTNIYSHSELFNALGSFTPHQITVESWTRIS